MTRIVIYALLHLCCLTALAAPPVLTLASGLALPSPDGRYVAACSSSYGRVGKRGIWLYDVKASTWSQLSKRCGEMYWLPDSKSLVLDVTPTKSPYGVNTFYRITLAGRETLLGQVPSMSWYYGWRIIPDGSGLLALECRTGHAVSKVIVHQYQFASGRWTTPLTITPKKALDIECYLALCKRPGGWLLACVAKQGDPIAWVHYAEMNRRGVIRQQHLDKPATVPWSFAPDGTWGADVPTSYFTALGATGKWPDKTGGLVAKPFGIARTYWPAWSPDSKKVAIPGLLFPPGAPEATLRKPITPGGVKPLRTYHVFGKTGAELANGNGEVKGWIGNTILMTVIGTTNRGTGQMTDHYYLQPLKGGKAVEFLAINGGMT